MQAADKTPSELSSAQQEQQRPGGQMPSLKPAVGPARHLVGRVSVCLPERQEAAAGRLLGIHLTPIPKFLGGQAYCRVWSSLCLVLPH